MLLFRGLFLSLCYLILRPILLWLCLGGLFSGSCVLSHFAAGIISYSILLYRGIQYFDFRRDLGGLRLFRARRFLGFGNCRGFLLRKLSHQVLVFSAALGLGGWGVGGSCGTSHEFP